MTLKRTTPPVYLARCDCGAYVGAIDMERTNNSEKGKLLGFWVSQGYTLEPRRGDNVSENLTPCTCPKGGTE